MRTNVIIDQDVYQSALEKGDEGYIDGYVRGGDERPYAVVVIPSKGIIELCPTTALTFVSYE